MGGQSCTSGSLACLDPSKLSWVRGEGVVLASKRESMHYPGGSLQSVDEVERLSAVCGWGGKTFCPSSGWWKLGKDESYCLKVLRWIFKEMLAESNHLEALFTLWLYQFVNPFCLFVLLINVEKMQDPANNKDASGNRMHLCAHFS